METKTIIQNQHLMDALVAAQEDIKYGHLTAQKEEESIEQLLDRITYKAQ